MTVSSSAKSSSNFLTQPSTIAILASLGIHGLVFAFLPLFSVSPQSAEAQPPEPVSVVELTPEQERRLPDLERSPRSLLPSSPLESGRFGLTPAPPNGDLFPGADSFSSSGRVPSRSPISPGGIISRRPSISPGYPATRYPTSRSIPGAVPAPRVVTPSIPSQPQPQPQPNTPATPSDPLASGRFGTSGSIPALDDLIARSGAPKPPDEATGDAEDLIPPVTPDDSSSPEPNANPSPSTSPSPETETSEANGETETPDEGSPEPPSPSPSPEAGTAAERFAQLRELYSYNPENTSSEAASQNTKDWFESLPPELSEDGEWKVNGPIDVTIEYPLQSCLPGEEPQAASIGVVVDANGEFLADPVLLRSTGYKGLNEAALEAVQEQIPAAEGTQAYTFRVKVNYDPETCLSSGEPASTAS